MAIKISPLKAGWFLTIFYAFGLAGFIIPQTESWMPKLVWVSIAFTFIILLSFHKKWAKEFVFALLLCGFCGFLFEVIGVKTSRIFGAFQFGNILGYSLWDTPLILIVSWMLFIYISRQIAEMIAKDALLISCIAAVLVIALDFFIEPFALHYGLWTWNSFEVPMQNYISRFIIIVLIQYVFIRSVKFPINKLSLPVYLIQLGFFIAIFFIKK